MGLNTDPPNLLFQHHAVFHHLHYEGHLPTLCDTLSGAGRADGHGVGTVLTPAAGHSPCFQVRPKEWRIAHAGMAMEQNYDWRKHCKFIYFSYRSFIFINCKSLLNKVRDYS